MRTGRSRDRTGPPWTRHGVGTAGTYKRIASRPASTDMQDSGVDGPHTTGMHRTSYRLHTPFPRCPGPRASARASSFAFLSPSSPPSIFPSPDSLFLSLFLRRYPPFLFAAFFLPLTSYHSGRVNGFGRPLGLPSANLVSLVPRPRGFLTGFSRRSIDESVDRENEGRRGKFS